MPARPEPDLATLRRSRLVRVAVLVAALLVLALGAWLLGALLGRLTLLAVALATGLLLAGVLAPVVDLADRHRVPRWLGSLVVVLLLATAVGGVVSLAGSSVAEQAPQLRERLVEVSQRLPEPLRAQVPGVGEQSGEQSGQQSGQQSGEQPEGGSGGLAGPLGEALGAVAVAFEALVGVFLTLAFTFLFLKDGRGMWCWVVARVPGPRRPGVDRRGRAAWWTVGAYVRALTVVALFDAVGIGLGLLVLGVPLVLTLALLQFVLSYIPTIGALLAGAVAVAVALVDGGVTTALLTLGVVVLVQQLGNNVVEPWVMGHRLHLHPAVVLAAVTGGGLLWGAAGALLAVPAVAAASAAVRDPRGPGGVDGATDADTDADTDDDTTEHEVAAGGPTPGTDEFRGRGRSAPS